MPFVLTEAYQSILESLPQYPQPAYSTADWNGFWVNTADDEIMCPNEDAADFLADFFEDCGMGIMHTYHYDEDDEGLVNEDCRGWWSVHVDGQ